jgi:hypothetical protein
VNIYPRGSDGFTPPSKIRLYYPLSPTRALMLGDHRDDPMSETEAADASQVARYNSLIVSASQHDLYTCTVRRSSCCAPPPNGLAAGPKRTMRTTDCPFRDCNRRKAFEGY